MKIGQLTDLFENLAGELLGHSDSDCRFAMIGMDEVLDGLRTNMSLRNLSLMLEYPEGNMQSTDYDHVIKTKGAFWIIRSCNIQDYKGIRKTMSETEEMGLKILYRLLEDAKKNCSGYDFEASMAGWTRIGPEWENSFGWRFEFNLITNR